MKLWGIDDLEINKPCSGKLRIGEYIKEKRKDIENNTTNMMHESSEWEIVRGEIIVCNKNGNKE